MMHDGTPFRLLRRITKRGFLLLLALIVVMPAACDYARMRDQESVRTYKKEMPEMDPRTIPVRNGFQTLTTADPATLQNPAPSTSQSVNQGMQAYAFYCIQCHGPRTEGFGTVGQSFAPLPTDLRSPSVQSQSDGELYAKIRLGFKRHPRLYTTISDADTWAVINYLRTLGSSDSKSR